MSFLSNALRRLHPLCLAAAACVTAGLAAPASAQIGELAGFTESMQREYLSRDLVIFSTSLEMDAAQRDILENLYEDYKIDFTDGLEAMQERLRSMKEELKTGDSQRILSMIFQPFEDWSVERRKLGEGFLENVQAILNREQMDLWPAFNRRLVREKTLNKGVLSGENLNLLITVRDLELAEPLSLSLQPVMDQYELALDDALRARNSILGSSQAKMVQSLRDQDARASLQLVDAQIVKRLGVRNVNDQYIELITAALPDELGATFYRNAMTKGYPKAWRRTVGMRMYDAASKLDDFDAETITSILDLRESFFDEMMQISEKIVVLTREYEPQELRNRVEIFTARMTNDAVTRKMNPTLTETRNRDRVDDRYIGILRGMLSDEDFRRLPGADRWVRKRQAAKSQRQAADDARRRAERRANAAQRPDAPGSPNAKGGSLKSGRGGGPPR